MLDALADEAPLLAHAYATSIAGQSAFERPFAPIRRLGRAKARERSYVPSALHANDDGFDLHAGHPDKLLALRQHPRLTAVCDLIANGLRQHPGERITMHDMRAGLRELLPALRQLPWPLASVAAA